MPIRLCGLFCELAVDEKSDRESEGVRVDCLTSFLGSQVLDECDDC